MAELDALAQAADEHAMIIASQAKDMQLEALAADNRALIVASKAKDMQLEALAADNRALIIASKAKDLHLESVKRAAAECAASSVRAALVVSSEHAVALERQESDLDFEFQRQLIKAGDESLLMEEKYQGSLDYKNEKIARLGLQIITQSNRIAGLEANLNSAIKTVTTLYVQLEKSEKKNRG